MAVGSYQLIPLLTYNSSRCPALPALSSRTAFALLILDTSLGCVSKTLSRSHTRFHTNYVTTQSYPYTPFAGFDYSYQPPYDVLPLESPTPHMMCIARCNNRTWQKTLLSLTRLCLEPEEIKQENQNAKMLYLYRNSLYL